MAMVLLTVTGAGMAQRYGSGDYEAAAGMGAGMTILFIVIGVLMIVSMWKVFTKAGKPGWAAIIPIYNFVVMLQIAQKPEWWIILMLIPFVNIIIGIIVAVAIAEKFGKSSGFAIGMILLPIVFYPILAFGDARYQG
jgi:hypothetical protein